MPLEVTTNPVEICALVGKVLAEDPVRGTVLGTILSDLRGPGPDECWCASVPGTATLAVRSSPFHPALLTGGWTSSDLATLATYLSTLPALIGISGPVEPVDEVAGLLARPAHRVAMRLFRLDALSEPAVPGTPRLATTADRDLLRDWCGAFGAEAGPHPSDPDVAAQRMLSSGRPWLWTVDGRPVSLAAGRAPERGSARIGPVYTPPAERGHGYGSAATAAATRDILATGSIPVLFTDLANPTSNNIYQELGYYPVEDRALIVFD